jgi:hypothetical protein
MRYQDAIEQCLRWQNRWRDPTLTGVLLLLGLEIFVGIPVARSNFAEAPVFVIVWFLLIIAAVLVAARHWVMIAIILLSSVLTLVANLMRLADPSPRTICLGSASMIVFMAALIGAVWSVVFGPGRVTHHRIQGAVVIYLCVALAFAALFEILLALNPTAITGAPARGSYLVLGRNLVYYSLETITSTGYGDIVPITPLARSLSNLESVIGQLFPATLLARIVTLQIHGRGNGTGTDGT